MDHDAFRHARGRLGLSVAQLAALLGVSQDAIRRYETPPDRERAREVHPIAATVMRWLLAGVRPPGYPEARHPVRPRRRDFDGPGDHSSGS